MSGKKNFYYFTPKYHKSYDFESLGKFKKIDPCCESLDKVDPYPDELNFIHLKEDEKPKKPEVKRENWKGKAEFFLSALAYAGVFLIPYFTFLLLLGIPLVFLELSVGQFTSTGPLTCWRMTPIFRGIGLSMNIVNGYLCIYYNMILAYSIYYLFYSIVSITSELPWQNCNPKWSSSNCMDFKNSFNVTLINCNSTFGLKCDNGYCYNHLTKENKNASCFSNSSSLVSLGIWKPSYPSDDFWTKVILQQTDTMDETGGFVWQLIVSLFVAWVIVWAMVVNGIKVSGKLVYFTSIFPYVVLIILGIRGWLLPGADIGIKYYIYPDFSRLKDYSVWTDAAVQLFFTLSVTYGGLITLSSYNKYNTNILRDAIIVSVSNCLTSVFAGFVIFSYMGYLTTITGQNIDDIVRAGQGLAYVVYPFAVTTLKWAPVWSILFFIMMLVLGMDTMMASVENLITSIFDIIPQLKRNFFRRVVSVTLICLFLFSAGLIFCTQAGTYWVEIIDSYSGNWAILIVAALECASVSWFYGFKKFKKDISTMLGPRITNHWTFNLWNVFWFFISPVILILGSALSLIHSQETKRDPHQYPYWTIVLGNSISVSTLSGVVIWALFAILDVIFINKRPLKSLFMPDSGWRPLKAEDCILVALAHQTNQQKETNDGKSNQGYNQADIEKF